MSRQAKLVIAFAVTCAVLTAAALAYLQWSSARYFDERHVRWLREQKPAYDQMAAKVLAQKATLTSQPRELRDVVPPSLRAFAMTNADGSVIIQFRGGEGGPRHGYLYHQGPLLTNLPGDPEAFLYHLTNEWYEY